MKKNKKGKNTLPEKTSISVSSSDSTPSPVPMSDAERINRENYAQNVDYLHEYDGLGIPVS